MHRYLNKITGVVVETKCVCAGDNWQDITPKQEQATKVPEQGAEGKTVETLELDAGTDSESEGHLATSQGQEDGESGQEDGETGQDRQDDGETDTEKVDTASRSKSRKGKKEA